jgi:hypothetical protein
VPVTTTSSAWSPQTTSNTGFSNSAGGSFGAAGTSGFSGNQNNGLSSSSNLFSSQSSFGTSSSQQGNLGSNFGSNVRAPQTSSAGLSGNSIESILQMIQANPSSAQNLLNSSSSTTTRTTSSGGLSPAYSGILPSGLAYQVSIGGAPSTTTVTTNRNTYGSSGISGNQFQNFGSSSSSGLSINELLSSGLSQ